MYTKALILLALAGVAFSRDLSVGSSNHGLKIFDKRQEASPAIWTQRNNVTIQVNETDVISGIVIKDARPEKDGEARIVEGGLGQQNVTVELKSPTFFRGYDFHIEVYAVPENEYVPELNDTTDSPVENNATSTDSAPKANEDKELSSTTVSPISSPGGEKVIAPVNIGAEDKEQARQNREITEVTTAQSEVTSSVKPEDESTSTPSSVTEEQDATSTTVVVVPAIAANSAHGAQIAGFRPAFVTSLASHPLAVATDDPTTVKSVHKRETVHLVEPMEIDDEETDIAYSEDENEEESIEEVIPKILLYTSDKLVTPVPYIL